jgi:hypothetical protein
MDTPVLSVELRNTDGRIKLNSYLLTSIELYKTNHTDTYFNHHIVSVCVSQFDKNYKFIDISYYGYLLQYTSDKSETHQNQDGR